MATERFQVGVSRRLRRSDYQVVSEDKVHPLLVATGFAYVHVKAPWPLGGLAEEVEVWRVVVRHEQVAE
jgi:hypothetical protein